MKTYRLGKPEITDAVVLYLADKYGLPKGTLVNVEIDVDFDIDGMKVTSLVLTAEVVPQQEIL